MIDAYINGSPMKNRLFLLLALSCSLMHTAHADAYNEYDFDDEDEAAGLVGFIKRHKILTVLATTATCASIVIYNTPTLWDKCVALATYANTVTKEVWDGLRSSDDGKQQGKDQIQPVSPEKKETSKSNETTHKAQGVVNQDKSKDKPAITQSDTVINQNKKKKDKQSPV